MEQKVLRAGTAMVVVALVLRLLSGALPGFSTRAATIMLFLQTGRIVRPINISFSPAVTEPPKPTATAPSTPPTQPETKPKPAPVPEPEPVLPVFSEADAAFIAINSAFPYEADIPALLAKPLHWDLTDDGPTVLIIHSHGSESYAPNGEYTEVSPYHTLNNAHNMISVGSYIGQLLEAGGISVVHDTVLHDNPSYNDSYSNSRVSMQAYLEKYPSIRLVLDLHRDAIEDADGNQVAQTVFAGDQTYAPLMLVVGTDYSGLNHPQWRENFSLALKLQTQLENLCPGIGRKINLRSQRFNQDLSTGALLVEIGTSGNNRQEALRSAKVLADAIISLAQGSR